MHIKEAIKQIDDGSTQIFLNYAPGYTAYVSLSLGDGFDQPDMYHADFCQGMMPPHSTERRATADEMAAYLTGQGWTEGWEIDEPEEY